jgi:hydrogenase maturation protein HypF
MVDGRDEMAERRQAAAGSEEGEGRDPSPRRDGGDREREYRVRGQVQGVGFRPFVYRLALEQQLGGEVWNDPGGVSIVLRGSAARIERFAVRLVDELPALAQIQELELVREQAWDGEPGGFRIRASAQEGRARGRVTIDSATCPDCVRELRDPSDPRHRHPLINCTNCGPRYTIVRSLPYDRANTTMAAFAMCPRCEREYRDPADRRFHAQPVCCPDCGPRLQLVDESGVPLEGDPIQVAAERLRAGELLAMKGLGGYHLVVDACNEEAVEALRAAKRRRDKPFALMFGSVEDALEHVELSVEGRELLSSPRSPIVLARILQLGRIASGVPAGTHRLGILLPYTPMQHLLLEAFAGPLVMTSANESDDPLLTDDVEVRQRLAPQIRLYLQHDRPIERAVDDSILIDTPSGMIPIRRARGYVPEPLPLPVPAASPGLTTGADLKNTVAVVREGECVLGQHVGDLEHARANARSTRTLADLQQLWELEPTWVAHDLHPDYFATLHAHAVADEQGLERIGVQHHHAHLGALLAEHDRDEMIACLVCDGVGYGLDGSAWGGEVLVGDLRDFERRAHVRPLRLPGGDAAAKACGRCALSWLYDLHGERTFEDPLVVRMLPDAQERTIVAQMLRRDLRCPPSTGVGRLFDAAAALLGVVERNSYEAQSGMLLEALAEAALPDAEKDDLLAMEQVLPWVDGDQLDTRPLLHSLLHALRQGLSTSRLALRFHSGLAAGLSALAQQVAVPAGVSTIGLSGGVFCNALLSEMVEGHLSRAGFEVLRHRLVPPNDGGLAYGQAAIAAARRARTAPSTAQ